MFFRDSRSGQTAEPKEPLSGFLGFEIHSDADVPSDFLVSHSASRRKRTIFIPGMDEDLPVKYPPRVYSLTEDELGIFPPASLGSSPTFFRLSTLKAIHSYRAPLYGALEFEGDTRGQFFYRPVHRVFIDSFLQSLRRHWLNSTDTSGTDARQPMTWVELNKIQEHLLSSELDPHEEVLNLSVHPGIQHKPRFHLGRDQRKPAACLVLTNRRLLVIASDEASRGLPSFVSIHSIRSGCVCLSSETETCVKDHVEFEASKSLGKLWAISIPTRGLSRSFHLPRSSDDSRTLLGDLRAPARSDRAP